jgi:hypothetical protein
MKTKGFDQRLTIQGRDALETRLKHVTDTFETYISTLQERSNLVSGTRKKPYLEGPAYQASARHDVMQYLQTMGVPMATYTRPDGSVVEDLWNLTEHDDLTLTFRTYSLADKIFKMAKVKEKDELAYNPVQLQYVVLKAAGYERSKENGRRLLDRISTLLTKDANLFGEDKYPTITPAALSDSLPMLTSNYKPRFEKIDSQLKAGSPYATRLVADRKKLLGGYNDRLNIILGKIEDVLEKREGQEALTKTGLKRKLAEIHKTTTSILNPSTGYHTQH